MDSFSAQIATHKKELNAYVRSIAKMVNDDWHDVSFIECHAACFCFVVLASCHAHMNNRACQGYEEYEQETQEWFNSAVESMDKVARVCVGEGAGFDLGLMRLFFTCLLRI